MRTSLLSRAAAVVAGAIPSAEHHGLPGQNDKFDPALVAAELNHFFA